MEPSNRAGHHVLPPRMTKVRPDQHSPSRAPWHPSLRRNGKSTPTAQVSARACKWPTTPFAPALQNSTRAYSQLSSIYLRPKLLFQPEQDGQGSCRREMILADGAGALSFKRSDNGKPGHEIAAHSSKSVGAGSPTGMTAGGAAVRPYEGRPPNSRALQRWQAPPLAGFFRGQ